jgi:hypothetical protein
LKRCDAVNERGAEPPELVVHDLDVKRWLGSVLLGLATKIVPRRRRSAAELKPFAGSDAAACEVRAKPTTKTRSPREGGFFCAGVIWVTASIGKKCL